MALTVQDLIEQARGRDEVIKTAKKGMRQESIEKLKSYITRPQRVTGTARKLDRKVGGKVRKAVYLLAPKGSMVKKITAPAKKKVKGRGRGRPRQTYKTRVLPSGRVVKVPTHIYKKLLTDEKRAIRLAAAQRQAIINQQAEEIAVQQDPRYQQSQEDAWADSEDMDHLQEVQRVNQQRQMLEQMQRQQQMEQPTIARRAGEMFGKARISLMGGQRQSQYQEQYPGQYPQQQQVQQIQPLARPQIDPELHRPVNPQVIVTSGKSNMFGGRGNIMDQRNEFNQKKEATIGFGR